MKSRELRPVGCFTLVLIVLAVGYEYLSQYRGVGSAKYVVTVESDNPNSVREASYAMLHRSDDADEYIARYTPDTPVRHVGGNPAELVSGRVFTMWDLTTSRRSLLGIAANSFTYRQWALIAVELEDGSRWAVVEELPDPRGGPKHVTCRLNNGRQYCPPQR